MIAKLCLFTCLFSAAQVDRSTWMLAPQFSRGQELVYSGIFREKSLVPGVNFQREYHVQTRLLLLDSAGTGWKAALLTGLELRPDQDSKKIPKTAKLGKASFRLEIALLDQMGQVRSQDNSDLTVSLDGLPTVEHGFLVPLPGTSLARDQEWVVKEPARPSLVWRVFGPEFLSGIKCIKLQAQQESANWKNLQSAEAAWKRTERVWIAVQGSVPMRVEREITHREAARTAPTHGSYLRYDLERQWTIPPGTVFEGHRQDIMNADKFIREAEQYLPQYNQNQAKLDALLKRIDSYLELRDPVEPYRQVMKQVQHRVAAVRRGEILMQPHNTQKPLIPVAGSGKRAPDFLVTNLITKRAVRLYEHLGQPVLIVFYNPHTPTGQRTLQLAKKANEEFKNKIAIFGMAVTNDTAAAIKQHKEMAIPFPILDGTGLHRTFEVDATPRFILLDAKGNVCETFTGWGFHVPDQVFNALHKCCSPNKMPDPQP